MHILEGKCCMNKDYLFIDLQEQKKNWRKTHKARVKELRSAEKWGVSCLFGGIYLCCLPIFIDRFSDNLRRLSCFLWVVSLLYMVICYIIISKISKKEDFVKNMRSLNDERLIDMIRLLKEDRVQTMEVLMALKKDCVEYREKNAFCNSFITRSLFTCVFLPMGFWIWQKLFPTVTDGNVFAFSFAISITLFAILLVTLVSLTAARTSSILP